MKGNLLVRGEWGELKRSSWCLLPSIGGGSEKNCFIGREGWGNESADSWTATTAPMIFFFAVLRFVDSFCFVWGEGGAAAGATSFPSSWRIEMILLGGTMLLVEVV